MQEESNTMNKKILGLGIIVLILFFIGGIFFLSVSRKPKTATVPKTGEINQSLQPTAQEKKLLVPVSNAAITVTSNGFEPQTITVKTKTQVIWTNNSGTDATVNSANHPTHQLYPPLNLGLFSNGSSVSLVFDKPGTYSYHDHLHPEKTGSIIVQ